MRWTDWSCVVLGAFYCVRGFFAAAQSASEMRQELNAISMTPVFFDVEYDPRGDLEMFRLFSNRCENRFGRRSRDG